MSSFEISNRQSLAMKTKLKSLLHYNTLKQQNSLFFLYNKDRIMFDILPPLIHLMGQFSNMRLSKNLPMRLSNLSVVRLSSELSITGSLFILALLVAACPRCQQPEK